MLIVHVPTHMIKFYNLRLSLAFGLTTSGKLIMFVKFKIFTIVLFPEKGCR